MKREESLVKVSNELVRRSSIKYELLYRVINDLSPLSELIPYRQKSKMGFCDKEKKIIIPCVFWWTRPFNEDLAVVFETNVGDYLYSVIDKKGNRILPPIYKIVNDYYESRSLVWNGAKYGFIDRFGKEIVPLTYDFGWRFNEGLAPMRTNNPQRWGFIDVQGSTIIPFKFNEAHWFHEGLSNVSFRSPSDPEHLIIISGNHGFINKQGEEVFSKRFQYASRFKEGFASVGENNKWGFINRKGEQVIPPIFKRPPSLFCDGLALIELNGKYGFINTAGSEVIPLKYTYARSFSEGLAPVYSSNWGYIDKKGNEVIPLIYESAEEFSEGLAKVRMKGKCGYINKNGELVIPCIYEDTFETKSFKNGLAQVKLNYHKGYIDKEGTQYWED